MQIMMKEKPELGNKLVSVIQTGFCLNPQAKSRVLQIEANWQKQTLMQQGAVQARTTSQMRRTMTIIGYLSAIHGKAWQTHCWSEGSSAIWLSELTVNCYTYSPMTAIYCYWTLASAFACTTAGQVREKATHFCSLKLSRDVTSLIGGFLQAMLVGDNPIYHQFLILVISREALLQDALLQISNKSKELKKPLKITFTSNGVLEEGIDQGGVTKVRTRVFGYYCQ